LFHRNRWKGDPIGFGNIVKGPPTWKSMKRRNRLHHYLEAGKTKAIADIETNGMGMHNHREIISQL
jgi:hypothetical protein